MGKVNLGLALGIVGTLIMCAAGEAAPAAAETPQTQLLGYWCETIPDSQTHYLYIVTSEATRFQLEKWKYANCIFVYAPGLDLGQWNNSTDTQHVGNWAAGGFRSCSPVCDTPQCEERRGEGGHGRDGAQPDSTPVVTRCFKSEGPGLLVRFTKDDKINRFGIEICNADNNVVQVKMPLKDVESGLCIPTIDTNSCAERDSGSLPLDCYTRRIRLHYVKPEYVVNWLNELAASSAGDQLMDMTVVKPDGQATKLGYRSTGKALDDEETEKLRKLLTTPLADSALKRQEIARLKKRIEEIRGETNANQRLQDIAEEIEALCDKYSAGGKLRSDTLELHDGGEASNAQGTTTPFGSSRIGTVTYEKQPKEGSAPGGDGEESPGSHFGELIVGSESFITAIAPATATNPTECLKNLQKLVETVDCPPAMIRLKVRVCEVSESARRLLGIDADPDNIAATWSERGEAQQGFEAFSLGDFFRNGGIEFNATLSALIRNGSVRILAEPNLTTVEGQVATYEAVQRVPYIVKSTRDFDAGTDTIEVAYLDIGIILCFKARIGRNETITVDIRPTVKSLIEENVLDPRNTGGIEGLTAPRYIERNLQTTTIVKSGEPLVLAGMITEQEQIDIDKLPILGDLPLLGKLFRKKDRHTERTEVCIIVVPEILSDPAAQAPSESQENGDV